MLPKYKDKLAVANKTEYTARMKQYCEDGGTVCCINDPDVQLKRTCYCVFPGIDLIYNDIHAEKRLADFAGDPRNLLEINHCRDGRMECCVDGDRVYLAPGDISLHRFGNIVREVSIPTGHYHGITIQIDLDQSPKCLSCFLEDVDVQPEAIAANALLNLGGNIQAVGSKPDGSAWRVAVQHPTEAEYLGVLSISDEAAITSGGYERYFIGEDVQTYWHIIDPATGTPADSGLISVTIVGKSGLVCDGLSTALFVMGLDKATQYWRSAAEEFEAILVTDDGNIYITEGLQEKFTVSEIYEDAVLTVITRG